MDCGLFFAGLIIIIIFVGLAAVFSSGEPKDI
jgi:hypothetical protein